MARDLPALTLPSPPGEGFTFARPWLIYAHPPILPRVYPEALGTFHLLPGGEGLDEGELQSTENSEEPNIASGAYENLQIVSGQ